MKKIVALLLLTLALGSCGEYQKALKSEDVAVKYELAEKLSIKIITIEEVLEKEAEQIKKYMDQFAGAPNYNIIPVKNDMSHIYRISGARCFG